MSSLSRFMMAALPALVVGVTFDEGAPSGVYENYVFAMEWQPQWSLPPNCDEELVSHMSPTSYASTHWSMHGLWPNYDPTQHDGMSWPQFCVKENGDNYTSCDGNYNAEAFCTPTSALDTMNNTADWQLYALEYSWSDLATHEWSKHGSCSPWESKVFFEVAQRKFSELIVGSGASFVSAHIGDVVSKDDLYNAFLEDTDGHRVVFNCDSDCNLSEVWTAWDLDAKTMLPTSAKDYDEDEPCSSSCTELTILAWTQDGDCPPLPQNDDVTTCEPDTHGPLCSSDDDCLEYSNCVRCASSGYCTDQP